MVQARNRWGRQLQPRRIITTLLLLMVLIIGWFGGLLGCSAMRSNSSEADHAGSDRGTAAEHRKSEMAADSSDSAPMGGEHSSPVSEEPMPPEAGGDDRYVGDAPEQVQAGQLTAGEWNDPLHWDWWMRLMNEERWSQLQEHWGFRTYDRLHIVAEAEGRPAVDAAVTLLDAQGQKVWEARTNQSGEAYLFAGLFAEDRDQANYSVMVDWGEQLTTVPVVSFNDKTPLTIPLQQSGETPDILDLLFLVDTTGSMGDELSYLKAELKDVVRKVAEHHNNELTIRLSANFYRDQRDEYVVRSFPFTERIDQVVDQISQQSADGGGDYEEAVEQGLEDAIEQHDWSPSARARLLLLVLDAPPHYTDDVLQKLQRLAARAAADGIRIIPVASSGVNKETEFLLRLLSIATGGTYVFLTDDSGIGNSHLEPTVGKYEVRQLNDLLVELINRYTDIGSPVNRILPAQ